jgi:hypothetical protein
MNKETCSTINTTSFFIQLNTTSFFIQFNTKNVL